jgi:hypothetical protein
LLRKCIDLNIIIGEWFWLPKVGGDVFKRLVNEAGLSYDRAKGFQVTSGSDLSLISSIIKEELREDVEVVLKCFICENPVQCSKCKYYEGCGSVKVYHRCVCHNCETDDVSIIYSMRFTELVG